MVDVANKFGKAMRRRAELGDKVAFADTEREVTFAQFEQRVDKLIDALIRLGVRRGDRVAILSRNCVSAVECLATTKAGLIPVPLNWRLSPLELVNLLNDCRPAALICDESWAEVAERQIVGRFPQLVKISFGNARAGWKQYESVVASGDEAITHPQAKANDTAFLIYTSGTTGVPKAAEISHAALVENGETSAREAICVGETDTVLCVMPLFHVGGLCYYLIPSYLAGATVILRPVFDCNELVRVVSTQKVTNVHLVPTMISDLVAHPDARHALTNLKRIVYAGSSMPVALLQRAMSLFSAIDLSQSYGSTEAGMISTLGPDEHRQAQSPEFAHLLRSCGRPLSGTTVRIVGEDGGDCPVNTPGEVFVRSNRTMVGYWNQPEKTADVIADGYLRTGDVGYVDGRGYLYLVDRKNDMIVTGGENVYPSEVEHVLYMSDDIAEAVVFGVPDSRWIEKVVAAVVLKPDSVITPEEIIEFAKTHLASYKCPKHVYVLDELPKSGAGKFSRKDLRHRFERIGAS